MNLSDYFTVTEQITDALKELGPGSIVILVCILIGIVLKQIPCVANWLIPPILIVAGATMYPFVGPQEIKFAVLFPVAFNIFFGACLGGAAVGLHQTWRGVTSFLQVKKDANTIPDSAGK